MSSSRNTRPTTTRTSSQRSSNATTTTRGVQRTSSSSRNSNATATRSVQRTSSSSRNSNATTTRGVQRTSSQRNNNNNNTDNDAQIARALAQQEQEYAIAELSNQFQRGGIGQYPGGGARNSNRASAAPPMVPPSWTTTHMCVVPCVMGPNKICVEMMVDTGAQRSIMSLSLAQELGLSGKMDQRYQGVAAGVGRANIVGLIRNIACELGHVEFLMDFSVLDTSESEGDKILLLGLDLMRKYNCIVNLQDETLIFGGKGGVEVSMLPADEQQNQVLQRLQQQCPTM